MPDKIQNAKIICKGGLISNQNWLDLSENYSGYASMMVNFEPSLYGGYRRINGFEALESEEPEIDSTGAEGKILGIFIYDGTVLCARKQQSGATYNFYTWSPSVGWTAATTGLTLTSTSVEKIRYETWNFDGTEYIGFVDGVNGLILYDGTNWSNVVFDGTTNTQMLDDVKFISVFKNHIFLSGSITSPHLVIHSAPLDPTDFSSASGAGQIVAGFDVIGIKPFRSELYVFGKLKLKNISVDSSASFLINDTATEIGCIATDSINEINGDIIFLAQDGIRPVSATERNGDIEIASISKNIQNDIISLISQYENDQIDSVLIRSKSQIRFFFSSSSETDFNARGIVGGLKLYGGGTTWEWGSLKGIKTACCTSGYINNTEYVLHGTYDGKVMRQEIGNSFDGESILSLISFPYLDFGDTQIRKTMRTINVFSRPEGAMELQTLLRFDWGNAGTINPLGYETTTGASPGLYGSAIYGSDVYGGMTIPIAITNVEGSCFSAQLTISSNNISSPYSIQGIVFEFSVEGQE